MSVTVPVFASGSVDFFEQDDVRNKEAVKKPIKSHCLPIRLPPPRLFDLNYIKEYITVPVLSRRRTPVGRQPSCLLVFQYPPYEPLSRPLEPAERVTWAKGGDQSLTQRTSKQISRRARNGKSLHTHIGRNNTGDSGIAVRGSSSFYKGIVLMRTVAAALSHSSNRSERTDRKYLWCHRY